MHTEPFAPFINPSLVSPATEFFVHEGQLLCQHNGQRYTYHDMPEFIRDIMQAHYEANAGAKKHLTEWAKEHGIDPLEQYTICLFGGYDHEPDIDARGRVVANEYYNCGKRGQCKYEGKVCPAIQVAYGYLSKTEIEIVRRAHKPTRHIAAELFVSEETINTHLQNIGRKTGYSRSGIIRFAVIKGIN